MKICFVGMEIIPSKEGAFIGGTANNVVRLAKELSKRGHSIHVITSDINRIHNGVFSTSWGEIYPIPIHGKYGLARSGIEFLVKVVPVIIKEYREKKFDILHFHSAYSVLGFIRIFSTVFNRIPSLFTLYSPIRRPLRDRKGIYQQLSSPIFSKISLSGGNIIAASENTRKSLTEVGFRGEEILFFPPVIDIAIFNTSLSKHEKREELGIPEEAPVVLYCGNWAVWKGVDILIESMVEVIKEFPGTKLITAWGEPNDWYDQRKIMLTKKIKNLHLDEVVIEVGIVKDIEKLMVSSNVFVAPFLNTDGVVDQPLTILEAMACGTPVVATKVGGIPEIVKHHENGLLINPGDKFELANAIIYMLENKKESKRMGINGAKLVSGEFKTEIVVDELERIYEGVISNYSSNRRH